jgi:lipoyl(octanoyl) transferase
MLKFKVSDNPILYPEAISFMEDRVKSIYEKNTDDLLWALEHPPLYTAGTSSNPDDLKSSELPVFETGRGGQYTYHGTGQRVYYAMINLKKIFKTPDIKKYVWSLEEAIILSLKKFGVIGERRDGRVGIWVRCPDNTEKKIAAIGVRIRHWVAYHGVSVNINPNLTHFNGIVPCGISEYGVTSFKDLGLQVTYEEFDSVFKENLENILYSS